MRLALAIVVAIIVAACAVQQSSSERSFVSSDGARMALAALDAEAILQGMDQARDANRRVARDLQENGSGATSPAVTR
jgi:hypothetical protein